MVYTPHFYRKDLDTVERSAAQIVPMVMELIAPGSVIDVGCGIGVWLSAFEQAGICDYLGVDGDYVERKMLRIPAERFMPFDLTRPLQLERQFDLVVSLEVAEHLPERVAPQFVQSLTRLGKVVLFSAAVPFQGGAHHVNEQWPEYWAKLFADQGYVALDAVRRRVWDDPEVEWWYAQNTLIYVHEQMLEQAKFRAERERTNDHQLAMVHPRLYMEQHRRRERYEAAARDLASIMEPGEMFVMADEEQLRTVIARGYRAIPFLEKDGVYWGLPADDEIAIVALEDLRRRGAKHLVVAWPAFWWLEHYQQFAEHVRRKYHRVLENERMVIFALS